MATQKKATQSGADSVEEIKVKDRYADVPAMIKRMADGVSTDLNKHQIEASIYGRLEQWAAKTGREDWEENMPRFVKVVREAAAARHEKAEKFKERNRLERQRLLARSELEAN